MAVRQPALPHSSRTQSANPVPAAGAATMSPPMSARQHALPAASSMAPSAPTTARPVASTNMPIVASVSGGWTGCPGEPCSSTVAFEGR